MTASEEIIKTWNFSAGPGVIPKPVLEKAQSEMLNFANTGCSLMELSHRSKEFEAVLAETEANLRSLLHVPSNYKILFMQGGATAQFSAVIYNLIGSDLTKPVDYIVTGSWSSKAVEEAKNLGVKVNIVVDTKPTKHNGALPPVSEWKFSPDPAFVLYCDNETIHGVEFDKFPFESVPKDVPIVCDMSSNILSKPIDVSRFGCIFAGAQKNMGPSGVTVVIIREDLIGTRKNASLKVPVMLDYKTFADNKSMYNTPPTFSIYICGLVFKWLLNDVGGLEKMAEINKRKSGAIYDAIKDSNGFYHCPVNENVRSRMNIPFRIMKDGEPSKELEAEFVKSAEKRGMVQLPGHRSVGGMRASLYNALPEEGAKVLAAFMRNAYKGSSCITLNPPNEIVIADPTSKREPKPFTFDAVFGPEADQSTVYDSVVRPLISKCLEGYNGCIFAYGQTASGKTYTMTGPTTDKEDIDPDQVGIILRTAQQIAEYVKGCQGMLDENGNTLECVVKASYMEIYNESITDLLASREIQGDLKIRIDPESLTGKDLYVQGLTEHYINSMSDYMKIIRLGMKNRTVAETNMNDESSRSHAILTITVDQIITRPSDTPSSSAPPSIFDLETKTSTTTTRKASSGGMGASLLGMARKRSKIHLVDLAGSERADSTGARGQRLKEGSAINQSLSSLGNVISALTAPYEQRKYVPYRDSKLTYLLSDSLGGNALTLMLTCCSPTTVNYNESLSTLRFAERVKKVQNRARINIDPNMLKFQHDELTDAIAEIPISRPGVFEYYVEYSTWSSPPVLMQSKETGSIVVDPRLYIPNTAYTDPDSTVARPDEILLPLDGICILTIIPKWMPTINRWPDYFSTFAEGGYNMVHFAPVSTRGNSNSPYSIYDQLALSPDLFDPKKRLTEDDKERVMDDMLKQIHSEYGILSITDVVWNHTACNSLWLQDHPESGYNLRTAPHLRSAFELDEALMHMADDIEQAGLSTAVRTEHELQAVIQLFQSKILPQLRLWEFYVINVKQVEKEFRAAWISRNSSGISLRYRPVFADVKVGHMNLKERAEILVREGLIFNGVGIRFAKTIRMATAVAFMEKTVADLGNAAPRGIDAEVSVFVEVLNEINLAGYKECDEDVAAIKENIVNRARYLRVDGHGPKLGHITKSNPIVDTYFTRLPVNERTSRLHPDEMCLANNGWIWNADPLQNFAGPGSKAYLRREVIAWGDCVKLRYGNGPEDNPWLWQHQVAYTEKMARLFHGFRIDNCHSTPIHVAAYLLDVARRVKPDLYVFAELFTGSEDKDITFVRKLGINSLIREAMNAWDPKELSRLCHRHGGEPVGSFTFPPEHFPLDMLGHPLDSTFYNPVKDSEEVVVDVRGSSPHALFMDCTHDNETPHQKRTAEDTLPNAALVAMSNCAVGSVKGYDEVVPELLNVVTETRKYRLPELYEGIIAAKQILLNLHTKMAREGYNEIHVHQEHDFISIHRVHPVTHDGYLLIARCAFHKHHGNDVHSPIVLRNQNIHVVESAGLRVQSVPANHAVMGYTPSGNSDEDLLSPTSPPMQAAAHINPVVGGPADVDAIAKARDARANMRGRKTLGVIAGLPCYLDFSNVLTTMAHSKVENFVENGQEVMNTIISIDGKNFSPGSILVYRTWMVGSGMELETPTPTVQQPPQPFSNGNGNLKPNPTPLSFMVPHLYSPMRSPSPELRRKKLIIKDPSRQLLVDEEEGKLEHLWRLIGLDNRNRGIEVMIQLGRDVGDSGQLCLTSDTRLWPPGLWDAVKELDAESINVALYRAGGEEADTIGDGTYDVPGFGHLPYCGLQGFMSAIFPIARANDLGHGMCGNLRSGTWMLDYVVGRLEKQCAGHPELRKLKIWLEERFALVKQLAPSFIPKYFFTIVYITFSAIKYQAITHHLQPKTQFICPDPGKHRVSSLETLTQSLIMTSYQQLGSVKSTGLFPSNNRYTLGIPPPKSTIVRHPALAAGLPHFATQHMRCWGRDIFISLRGLLMIPGHWDAARMHLISFGSTLKHGLIPNLLDQGNFPRYNARDAAWWWLWGVQQYCKSAPEGLNFLGVQVMRRFPPKRRYRQGKDYLKVSETDEIHGDEGDNFVDVNDPKAYKHINTIGELCHEILERHANGIHFREWNAGSQLDHAMSDAGFEVTAKVKFDEGGLVTGGNRFNCGTWMDKMGDSSKAGTKGLPATPRDGADVEIVGLCKATLRWVSEVVLQSDVGKKNWPAVEVCISVQGSDGKTTERKVSYESWNELLQKSFESYFYIPLDASQDGMYKLGRKELVNRRGIYKDTVGASQAFADYQFRPNFLVAMVVAPEMFNPDHARKALDLAKTVLLGPLGMKTLDPTDWTYRPHYDNANDSTDPTVAHGYNYHQGPEWGWLLGYFLRAYLYFNIKAPGADSSKKLQHIFYIQTVLQRVKFHMADSLSNPFAGMPELTNLDGAKCRDSCPTQAWSSATMLELIKDLYDTLKK
ncbi:hypothetical protein HDV05_000618 [Chytridiales sp. JEL 0842]|nr:hypothetical protein HDV05_000618 [Chytridiales sp. JEL 0842]